MNPATAGGLAARRSRPGTAPRKKRVAGTAASGAGTRSKVQARSASRKKAPASAAAPQESVIRLNKASLALGSAKGMVKILHSVSLDIRSGERVGVLGPSGAGKTSLLMVMAGLEGLTGGRIDLVGHDITKMGEDRLATLRRDNVGIVFQAFRLIPSMTAIQNVRVPLELARRSDAHELAKQALDSVGLSHRRTHLPDELSGGEQQRVAIARAIVAGPRIIMADEPTGNLDSATSELVISTLFKAVEGAGAALVLVTHDPTLAHRCERILTIEDGRIVSDRRGGTRTAGRS